MAEEASQMGKAEEMADSWASAFAQARAETGSSRAKTKKAAKQAESQQIPDEIKEFNELSNKLMEPQYWEALVRAPADFMLAKTGHQHWDIPNAQVRTLAVTGSITVRAWMPNMDPKYMCLALFLTNAAFIYGTRFLEELRLQREELLDKKEKREVKS